MKKIISIILLLSIIFSIFTACSSDNKKDNVEFKLYFSNSAKDSLVTENAELSVSDRKNTVSFVRKIMTMLLKGPSTEGYTSVIPEGVHLRGISLEKGEDGKYYDKETGKAYESVEDWVKEQKTPYAILP